MIHRRVPYTEYRIRYGFWAVATLPTYYLARVLPETNNLWRVHLASMPAVHEPCNAELSAAVPLSPPCSTEYY